ncbi:FG-GAP repeat domain-containing protein [Actinosynnema sp. ALI-1.44]|uniref:FG-GAP repeat domain-containing protein n=1 Tax=Actinosynnema sp. ALI-1.44 TaxID=1933779 RepID=UPI00143CEE22|nr:VCBS repeat-containing protein [Actinosynnema sp. ALI-1.44]
MVQTTAASAAPQQADKPNTKVTATKVDKSKFAKKGATTRGSGSSGGQTGDIDLAGKDDILAVGVNPPSLYVYPNKGYDAANPTATYGSAVTINYNWGGQKWVGQGKVNGDAFPDVLAIDGADNLYSHKHSGTFAGTGTLNGAQLISTGWSGNNLVFVHDVDHDGIDDIVARKAGTEDFYYYRTTVVNGVITQSPAEFVIGFDSPSPIVDAAMADFTADGVADFVLRLQNGGVIVYDITVGQPGTDYLISYGWTGINAFTISDVNSDGKPDILGRVAANGDLNLYPHTGTWAPAADGTAFNTLGPIKVLGYQWNGLRIIT